MNATDFQKELISHEKSLLGFAYRFTSNQEDAKDLLQETFLKALKYKDKFAQSTNLKAWLYTIMKNTFINAYRKASRANTIIDETEENYFLKLVAGACPGEEKLIRQVFDPLQYTVPVLLEPPKT